MIYYLVVIQTCLEKQFTQQMVFFTSEKLQTLHLQQNFLLHRFRVNTILKANGRSELSSAPDEPSHLEDEAHEGIMEDEGHAIATQAMLQDLSPQQFLEYVY